MGSSAVIDRCGFDSALRGVAPGSSEALYEHYILPHSEYRAYMGVVFDSRRPSGARWPALQELLAGVAGPSQPYGLTLGAASHISLPEALHDIPVVLSQISSTEILDVVRIRAAHPDLPAGSASFIEAAIRARADVIACGHEQNLSTLAALRNYQVPIALLNHDCRLRPSMEP